MPTKQHDPTTTKPPTSLGYGASLQEHKTKHPAPGPVGTTYQACHYMYGGKAGTDLEADARGTTLHVDYCSHDDIVFVLRDGQWAPEGKLHVDVDCYIEHEDVSLGRFHLSEGFLGDVVGPWVWNYGARKDGRGVGVLPQGAADQVVKVGFLVDTPPGLPPAPPPLAGYPGVPGFDEVSYLTLTVS